MSHRFRYRWTGTAWQPLARFAQRCREAFTPDQISDLEVTEERSTESHNHYMACVVSAWQNLPESIADRFGSPEHLRKWALIVEGYRNVRIHAAPSPEEAREWALFIAPLDEFAVIVTDGNCIHVMTAKTQKLRRNSADGMDKQEFEASKDAVLRRCSILIGVDVVTLLAQEAPSIAPSTDSDPEFNRRLSDVEARERV